MLRVRSIQAAAAALLLLGVGPIGGCGEREEPSGFERRDVAIAEVPENVIGSAKKALPGIKFAEAWKNVDKDGKLLSYEVRGRASNGKIREVRVSPDGAILEQE